MSYRDPRILWITAKQMSRRSAQIRGQEGVVGCYLTTMTNLEINFAIKKKLHGKKRILQFYREKIKKALGIYLLL